MAVANQVPDATDAREQIMVSDYGIFNNAIASTQAYNAVLDSVDETVKQSKTKLSDQSIFMGPIQENSIESLTKIDTRMEESRNNFQTINSYLVDVSSAYQRGDKEASNVVLNLDGKSHTGTSSTGPVTYGGRSIPPVSSTEIPDDIEQSGYTVTCYGKDGWHISGSPEATGISPNTKQAAVHDAWVADGARYKDGIAVMNVDGQDCYLVATAPKVGQVGDTIDVRLANGQTIPCVVADAKSPKDSTASQYGHVINGKLNVLEFEVDTGVFMSKGTNPTTEGWGLEWDSSSNVKSVDNYGPIV